jgi:trans-aconitate methyltransferase
MGPMTQADFEARYRADPDPWGYTTSEYEREKYRATAAACGEGPFESAIELGSSIGVFTEMLAPRCRELVAIDGSPTAVAAARRRLAGTGSVTTIIGTIPESIPAGPFDLVLASEILYYLSAAALSRTLELLAQRTVLGGRWVAVHWRPQGAERPFDAASVHERLRASRWLAPLAGAHTDDYLLDVLERR